MPALREFLRVHRLTLAQRQGRAGRLRVKRPGRPRHPLAIEQGYARDLRALAEQSRMVLQRVLAPRIHDLAVEAGITTIRHDAYAQTLERIMALVRSTHAGLGVAVRVRALAEQYAADVNEYNRRDTLRLISKALGVDVFLEDPKVRDDIEAFVTQNVRLISSIPESYFDRVESDLLRGLRAGTRVEELQDIIEEDYKVPAARAELIARDQVGKFNGQLAQLRQEELGIEEYVWRTVGDERVRDWHRDLDGQTFRWDEPPVTNAKGDRNHPGGDYQCRCTAEPIIRL